MCCENQGEEFVSKWTIVSSSGLHGTTITSSRSRKKFLALHPSACRLFQLHCPETYISWLLCRFGDLLFKAVQHSCFRQQSCPQPHAPSTVPLEPQLCSCGCMHDSPKRAHVQAFWQEPFSGWRRHFNTFGLEQGRGSISPIHMQSLEVVGAVDQDLLCCF